MLYHIYIDEGGMFGTPHVLVSKNKLTVVDSENDITHYYQGEFSLMVLARYLKGLQTFWKGKIKLSCDDYVDKTLKEYYKINFEGVK